MEIKKVIRKHGWTIEKVAANMVSKRGNSLSDGSLSMMIRGNITTDTLRRIANIIGANMTEFFEDEIETPNNLPDMNKEVPEFAGEITMNGKRYGLVEIE